MKEIRMHRNRVHQPYAVGRTAHLEQEALHFAVLALILTVALVRVLG